MAKRILWRKWRYYIEAIQNNPAYRGLTAPTALHNRYIYEDVPYSLVPIASIAQDIGIETPAIDTIIRLANIMTGQNFYEEGRTVEKLGLKGLDIGKYINMLKLESWSTE